MKFALLSLSLLGSMGAGMAFGQPSKSSPSVENTQLVCVCSPSTGCKCTKILEEGDTITY